MYCTGRLFYRCPKMYGDGLFRIKSKLKNVPTKCVAKMIQMFLFIILAFIPRKWGQLLVCFYLHIVDHVFVCFTWPPTSSLITPIKFFNGLHLPDFPLLLFRPDFFDYLVITFSFNTSTPSHSLFPLILPAMFAVPLKFLLHNRS